jgi:hypothetical protein
VPNGINWSQRGSCARSRFKPFVVFLMSSLVGLLCQFMSYDADDSSNSFCSSVMARHGCTGNSLSESTPRSETVMLVVDQVISVWVLLLVVIT